MEVYSLSSFSFWVSWLLFLLAVYLSWFLPGQLILAHKKLSFGLSLLLSLIVGMVLWGMQGYLLGYLHVRFLTYGYLFIVLALAFQQKAFGVHIFREAGKWLKNNPLLTGIVLLGVIIQAIPVVGSGLRYPDGVGFVGVNSVDGVMHLSFIRSIVNYFPPIEPGAVGNPITNYHYWSDLIIAELIRVWRLPTSHVFFQFMPILISTLTALAAYQVMRVLGFSKTAGIWAIFFLFFAGDAAYALTLILYHKLSFTAPALDNGATQFLNMPNAMARPIFLTSIITLSHWLKERKLVWGVTTILLFASLVGIKVYYGMFVILGISLVAVFHVVRQFTLSKKSHAFLQALKDVIERENLFFILLPMLGVLSAAIFLPPNKEAGGLQWYPLEWPKLFLGPGALNWGEWWLRHQVYEQAGNIRNLIVYDTLAIVIALISVHGTRLLGLFPKMGGYKKLGWEMSLFLIPGLILFHVLGLFTLQVSGGFNVFNFFVVGAVVLSLLSAMVLDNATFSRKHLLRSTLLILLIVLSVPRVIYETSNYVKSLLSPKNNTTIISNDELDGLTYIKKNTPQDAVIQSHPTDPMDSHTPYVSFFTDRLTYLTGVELQNTHNQPIEERKRALTEVFAAQDSPSFFAKAREKGIDILFLKKDKGQDLSFDPDSNLIKKIFENKTVVVYQITDK